MACNPDDPVEDRRDKHAAALAHAKAKSVICCIALVRASAAPVDHVVLDAARLPLVIRSERAAICRERIRRLLSRALDTEIARCGGPFFQRLLVVTADSALRGAATRGQQRQSDSNAARTPDPR